MKAREIDLGYRPRPWQEEVHRTRRRFWPALWTARTGFAASASTARCSTSSPS